MNIGIYCLYFDNLDNQYYIGCSSNLTKRVQWHLSMLKALSHPNKRLQQAFMEYGTPTIEIIDTCLLEQLKGREIHWIREFDSFIHGFNNTNGGDGVGFGEGVHNALYTEQQYIFIARTLATTNLSLVEVSKILDVKLDVVKHISNLSAHSWIEEKEPEIYSILRNKYTSKGRDNSASSKGIIYPILISPTGMEYVVTNIHAFCKEHDLQPQNLHKVLTLQRVRHKGWEIKNASNP